MEGLFFPLYFSFYTIFSDTATLEKSLSTTPYGKFGWFFFPFLAICLHTKIKCDLLIPSGNICDQRILQFNLLKTFLAIIQEQEFPQIRDLYSKIDKKINFYLSTFPTKTNHKIIQNKPKSLLWGHFRAYFAIFAQRGFFLKSPTNYNCNAMSRLTVKPKIIPSLSACKNH